MFSIAGTAGTGSSTPPASVQPDATQPLDTDEAIATSFTSQYAANSQNETTIAATIPPFGTTTSNDDEAIQAAPPPRVVTLSSPLTTLLAAQYANAAEHMLLGKLQGRNQPSARELSAWCKKHLHSTFLHMIFLGQGYFEVAFSSPDGKEDTLRRSGFFFGELEVVFSLWQPSFEPEDPVCVDSFSYAIWAQFCGLNSLLRTKECLTEIGKHIGVVLAVEEDDSNRATIAGLRVRISVSTKDLKTLPKRIEIPQIGNYGGKTCKVVYSGLPEKCLECDTYAHSPKNCPLHVTGTGSSESEFLDADSLQEFGRAGQVNKSYYSTEKGKGVVKALKPLRLQRQTSGRPDERIVFQQALSFVDNPLEEDTLSGSGGADWNDGNGKYSNKALGASVNSQYTMTLSGPLSAPHSPPHTSQEVASRWASSCAGISPISTKFSSRPAHAM